MSVWAIFDATAHDIDALLAQPLRHLDVQEWESGTGMDAKRAFKLACYDEDTVVLRALKVDRVVVAIWGVMDGSLWMMGAEVPYSLPDARVNFFGLWKDEINLLHLRGGPTLVATADNRNVQHHRWLYTMGFRKGGTMTGGDGAVFTHWTRSQA